MSDSPKAPKKKTPVAAIKALPAHVGADAGEYLYSHTSLLMADILANLAELTPDLKVKYELDLIRICMSYRPAPKVAPEEDKSSKVLEFLKGSAK